MSNSNKAVEILRNNNLTAKAKFLYEQGLCKEGVTVEKIGKEYLDVTYGEGFKEFKVYLKENTLFIARPDAEEEQVYNYTLIEIEEVTDEQLEELKLLANEETFSLDKIFKYTCLTLSAISLIATLILFITYFIAGSSFDVIMTNFLFVVPNVSILIGITGLLFKKK